MRARSVGTFGATWRGMRDALCGIAPIWRERRRLQAARQAPTSVIARALTWPIGKLRRRAHDVRPA